MKYPETIRNSFNTSTYFDLLQKTCSKHDEVLRGSVAALLLRSTTKRFEWLETLRNISIHYKLVLPKIWFVMSRNFFKFMLKYYEIPPINILMVTRQYMFCNDSRCYEISLSIRRHITKYHQSIFWWYRSSTCFVMIPDVSKLL